MARRVFFSFHYERDIWRVNNVRNSWVVKGVESSGFIDAAEFEQLKRTGDAAIQRWIDNQMKGTSVTVVLIGSETNERDWVDYEIRHSFAEGKGLLGVHVHGVEDKTGKTDERGPNPLDNVKVGEIPLSRLFATYDWVRDDGRNNMGKWIEDAAARIAR